MMRTILSLAAFCLCSFALADKVERHSEHIKRPFAAQMRSFNANRPHEKSTTDVVLTKWGTKIASMGMFGGDKKGVLLQSFVENKSWLVDPKARIFAELRPEKKPVIQGQDIDKKNEYPSSGVMSTAPCLHTFAALIDSHLEKKASLRGHDVTVWRCQFDGFDIVQYYSIEWGLVLREEWPNHDVVELLALRDVDFPPAFFKPLSSFREVSLKAFYTGSPTLESYVPMDEPRP